MGLKYNQKEVLTMSEGERYPKIPAGRQRQVLAYIEKHKSAQIKEIADYFGVSEATARRDLDDLDMAGYIIRTHGGAVKKERGTSFEEIHSKKMQMMLDCKKRIAKTAASLVQPGDSVFLDAGTTTYFIAQELSQTPNLMLFTYDLFIANAVSIHPSSTLAVTGGIRRNDYNVLVGSDVEEYIRRLHVNKVFLGADAIDQEFGVSNANLLETSIKRLLLKAGNKVILVSDHSKLGRTALSKVCSLSELDGIVMDNEAPSEAQDWLKQAGPELMLV